MSDPNRDYFVLSKGHASLGLYAVLADKGIIDHKKMVDFCAFDSLLGGHPNRNKIRGVEASTGSLGHGVPIAIGIALGIKTKKNKGRVFVLAGDGELNEGTIWESALLAAHHKLDNLCLIIDHNHSTDRALKVDDLRTKFTSFGWNSFEVNGHDHKGLTKLFKQFSKNKNKPMVLIANTIKGHGVPSIHNNPAWHHKSPNDSELPGLLKEIQNYA
jgi:transketolase